MDTKVHCDHCGSVLRVPESAAGHWAKCPSCQGKFKVPQPKELLEETVSTWIEDDVDELQDEVDEQYKNLTLAERQRLEQKKQERLATTAEQLRQVLQARGVEAAQATTAAPAKAPPAPPHAHEPPVKHHHETVSTIAHAPPHHAAPHPPPVVKAPRLGMPPAHAGGPSDVQAAQDYPNDLFPVERRPHLVVGSVDQTGVTLVFDSMYLEHVGFRLSMPVRCVYTGQTHWPELTARPLAFCDRSQTVARSPHQIEENHEARLVEGQDLQDMLWKMGFITFLPKPFDHVMPYYVTAAKAGQSLACRTYRRTDGGISCYVSIPDGFYALEWLGRVNGVCGRDYLLLSRDVHTLWSDAWQGLPEELRYRVSVWCGFEPGEYFRCYVNDADFARKDEGLAGVVLTDRRLIFHKYHRSGSLRFADKVKLAIRPDPARGLAAVNAAMEEGHVRALTLHLEEVPAFIEAVKDTGLELDLSEVR